MSDQQTVSGAVEQATATPKMSTAADELQGAEIAYDALRKLDPQSRYRVMGWLSARLNWEQNDHDEEPF